MSEQEIPEGWKKGTISDIAEVNPSVSVSHLRQNSLVSFIAMADVSENGRLINKHDKPLHEVSSGFTRFKEKDTLFAKITPCMENGKGAFAQDLANSHGFGSTEFHVLRANDYGDPSFLYHLSLSKAVRTKAVAFFTGSAGQQRVDSKFFNRYPILIPPVSQQRKIARILTTLDELIEKTEALIAKYQVIKQGLMHDLFTRGVDEHGQLRPPYEEAPELYKESELGWIPKEWETKTLNNVVSQSRPIVYGILMPGYGHQGGVPVIKVKDIKNGVVDQNNLLLTSPDIDSAYKRSKTITGDLLFTIRGTVGRTAFVPESLNGANITQDTARIGVVEGDSRFIRGYLEMPEPNRFIACHTLGVAVQGINLGDVRRIPVAFPLVDEQKCIGDLLEGYENYIQTEDRHLAKLKLQKFGLMHALLTGEVEVTVDNEEITHAR